MLKAPIVLILSLMISGCAFGTRHPLLQYHPVTANANPKNITLFVEKFKDERTEKNVIGHVRNGWGMKTAEVVTDTNIADWVTEALKSELGNGGYIVAKDRTELTTGGEVLRVYCDSYMQYEGEVTISVILKKGETVLLNKKYTGSAKNFNWAATAESYGKTVEQSLQSAMKQLIDDLNTQLASL